MCLPALLTGAGDVPVQGQWCVAQHPYLPQALILDTCISLPPTGLLSLACSGLWLLGLAARQGAS